MVDAGVKTTVNLVPEKPRKKINIAVPIFAAAGVIIVGLVIAIVVVKVNESLNAYPSSMHTARLEEVNEVAAGLSVDEARQLYEEVIENANGERAKSEARVEYGRYLLEQGLSEEGLIQLSLVDEESLDSGYKILLFSALRSYYSVEGDSQELVDWYNERIGEVVSDSNYAAGGGA